MGPDVNHVPCHLGQQERLEAARRARLIRALRRRRRGRGQPVTAEEAAVPAAPDVWSALRF